MPPTLEERLSLVREGVADAAAQADRRADDITTIVVTKFHPASLVRELHALGVHDFGENRHQEAQAKAAELADLSSGIDPIHWNFIGQLQSKKAKQVRAYASSVQSLDRDSVLDALAAPSPALDVFVQLNLTDDPGRGGVRDEEFEPFVERVLQTSGVLLRGVMAVAPLDEEPRRAFARVRAASERMRALAPTATAISAGMSGDYRDAILEGATHLRIGSAITGNRPVAG
ncbi:YggS family pyridoxal phosphate-dependent enzyme [Lacisediminihabitans changchengi]|uniref:Pyridoxal phosphate homeostasis protein n=1 Tax=Lacisediminihabitans changchengi TaxID=2787634 RepID=A0A934W3C2_9MICO|nr:YggS family pyridoxal phosphate-dependent enzyme [Lacisediminihabitans changchengi]MBK4347761.1 YggS family pyridoxal phosphate-dependent enzyme [Lacisediminihabitans changchengi]